MVRYGSDASVREIIVGLMRWFAPMQLQMATNVVLLLVVIRFSIP